MTQSETARIIEARQGHLLLRHWLHKIEIIFAVHEEVYILSLNISYRLTSENVIRFLFLFQFFLLNQFCFSSPAEKHMQYFIFLCRCNKKLNNKVQDIMRI